MDTARGSNKIYIAEVTRAGKRGEPDLQYCPTKIVSIILNRISVSPETPYWLCVRPSVRPSHSSVCAKNLYNQSANIALW